MKYDVIIVLAGGMTNDFQLPKTVKERVRAAYKAYTRGLAPRIIMSGQWSKYWELQPPGLSEASLMTQYAVELGLPRKALLKEEHSQTTYENVMYSYHLFLEPRAWKKVLVITSDFHQARVSRILHRILSAGFSYRVMGIKSNGSSWQRLKWSVKEQVWLRTEWLIEYFSHRR